MKELGSKLNKLAIRLRNNQREIDRLMEAYETLDAVVVRGSEVQDMDDWLVQPKRKRRVAEVKSEPLESTQSTDSSHRSQSHAGESQISDAASEALAQQRWFHEPDAHLPGPARLAAAGRAQLAQAGRLLLIVGHLGPQEADIVDGQVQAVDW